MINRIKNRINSYVDERFEDYRGQIARDVAKGLGALAGLLALWTAGLVAAFFVGVTFALLFASFLPIDWGIWRYLLGFITIALLQVIVVYILLQRRKTWIEQPVEQITASALRSPESAEELQQKLEEEAEQDLPLSEEETES